MELTIVLIITALLVVFYIVGIIRKKRRFNSIEPGDKIYYMPGTNGATLFKKKETSVIGIERDNDNNVEYIYTEDGGKYDFLDYKKEIFTISINTLFD